MTTEYTTLKIDYKNAVATIWLNRPKIHNAFNEKMISEIIEAFDELIENKHVKVIKLRGEGKSFCAGADLNWMRDVANYSYEENYKESYRLSECFYKIYSCPKPTIAIVHGAAIGGANGLLSACDLAYADNNSVFSLSEVKIGIVPACISPYVIKRVGEYNARELMLTGKRINGEEAAQKGLINKALASGALDEYVDEMCSLLLTSGPEAIKQCKILIDEVANKLNMEQMLDHTARMIADIRKSEEGQEGMAAFLEKRKPNWISE